METGEIGIDRRKVLGEKRGTRVTATFGKVTEKGVLPCTYLHMAVGHCLSGFLYGLRER